MATFATWNPSDKGTNIVLSNGNLTVAVNPGGGTWNSVRSTISVSSGKWYWENTLSSATDSKVCGIALSTATLANYIGNDANGWSYYGGGPQKINSNIFTNYGATYANGDVIGVALDMDGGTVIFYKNGVSQGTAFTGLSGAMFAGISANQVGDSWTTNFGATPFAFTVPTGYNPGLYTGIIVSNTSNLSILKAG